MVYEFKTKPYDFQREAFDYSKELEAFGLFFEQGCGKTKVAVDTIAYLMQSGEVENAIVVAPDGVHQNWGRSYGEMKCQWETHCPDHVFNDTEVFIFNSVGSSTKKWEKEANRFCRSEKKKLLCISYNGLQTKRGRKLADFINNQTLSIVILDEAHKIKNFDTKRTKSCIEFGNNANYRRILTGTLISQSLFDAYAPIMFLDPTYWEMYGLGKYWSFKNYFGVFKTLRDPNKTQVRRVKVNGQWQTRRQPLEFKKLISYRNEEELQSHIHRFGMRVKKEDVLSELPPMTYKLIPVPLSSEQRKFYDNMENEFFVELQNGEIVDAQMGMTKLQKLHQICQGWMYDEEKNVIEIGKTTPRFEVLMDLCESTDQNVIIWTPFVPDIKRIVRGLEERGKRVVSYYGDTDKKIQRVVNREAYQSGDAQFFVANPAVAGEGIDLTNSGIMIYYANSYSVLQREQSGDRVARPGLKNPWTKIDIVSIDTFEDKILQSLEEKQNVASYLMKDYESRIGD